MSRNKAQTYKPTNEIVLLQATIKSQKELIRKLRS